MITSAVISQLRRETGDIPKLTRMARTGDGAITIFNTGRFPVVEGSYTVYKGTSGQTETTHYSLDLDSGDLTFQNAPASSYQAIFQGKYANWRDKNWVDAINNAVDDLAARGYFRQVVRLSRYLSAGVRSFSAPSACVDAYELLESRTSGSYQKLGTNWSYQQGANKIVLGNPPTVKLSGAISYLRSMQKYTATSATLDVQDEWVNLIKKNAKAQYWSFMAGKSAAQGNAKVEEGHFSFTSLRTQARDLMQEFQNEAPRYKPTRPAKDIQWQQENGGVA